MTNRELAEAWMVIIRRRASGRTRWEGQEPRRDEAVLAELERLYALESAAKAAGILDERGEVRKVLGTLPVTKDGVSVMPSETAFHRSIPQCDGTPRWSDEEGWLVEFDLTGAGEWKYYPLIDCYSTRAAALATRDRDPNGPGGGE